MQNDFLIIWRSFHNIVEPRFSAIPIKGRFRYKERENMFPNQKNSDFSAIFTKKFILLKFTVLLLFTDIGRPFRVQMVFFVSLKNETIKVRNKNSSWILTVFHPVSHLPLFFWYPNTFFKIIMDTVIAKKKTNEKKKRNK